MTAERILLDDGQEFKEAKQDINNQNDTNTERIY